MNFTKIQAFLLVLLIPAGFFSCSSRISGVLREGGTAEFTVSTRLEPRMTSLIRSFQFMMGSAGTDLILDGKAIGLSMAAAPGMGSVVLDNTGPAAIDGKVGLNAVGDFLSIVGREKRFVTFTENERNLAGHSRIVISLDRETAPDVISLLSSDAAAYLSALMAPAATGEVLSRDEYLVLVGSLYGQGIADEISTANITASIDFPGRITAIQGGTASGRRAEFQVPLTDLLVLENPLIWEITWVK